MRPEFREGDVVVIDPAIVPRPGDFVVGSSQHGATFRKYRPRGPNANGEEVFELAPLNEDYPSMRSDITAITLVGTMVEHRRYRRP
jgi:SOS-response transcriptional repressor LexA